ncbi:MAG: tetraacyldisaccharide 4'-kinase [Deltaproteobacteria bacterium]|nr:tetraacyldisaccharide 4'-kinase [Deltaproteobacteria bacterium]
MMKKMIDWQRIWDDDGNTGYYSPVKIIANILSFFYRFIINFRNWLYDKRILKETALPCLVISVGNITVGGTGKTPCVIMLAQMLRENGFKPAVISRGYGGEKINPVNIVSDGREILLDSRIAGDEPFLIAQELKNIPVLTGAKRILTGKTAVNQFGANVLICDDAMQHRQIFRDINLVLLDSRSLSEKNHILPRGRLREPMTELKRASAIVITRTDEAIETGQIEKLFPAEKIPVFRSIHKPNDIIKGDYRARKQVSELKGKKVCAFCGIANPNSFRKTLSDAGAQVLSFDVFPDHHSYSKNELEKIRNRFIDCQADFIVSTQKDGARLQNFPEFLNMIYILRIEMEIIPKSDSFNKFILDRLAGARQNKPTTRKPA